MALDSLALAVQEGGNDDFIVKGPSRLPFNLHRLRLDARMQILILATCHFSSIGMWNSLNGLGGLGTGDEKLAHYCNSLSYISGIIGGFISGSVVNCLGLKKSAFLGCFAMTTELLGYYLYSYPGKISLWTTVGYNALAGILVACLTSSVGAGLVQYPTEDDRNLYIAIASVILNAGGLIGALISLAMNTSVHSSSTALSSPSYLVIISVSALGMVAAMSLASPNDVIRKDGTHPIIPKRRVMAELKEVGSAFKSLNLYLMAPLFCCNVWHEVVLFNFFNSTIFNVRSRAFNTIWYYLARIAASFFFQVACDAFVHLKARVLSAITVVSVFVAVATVCGAMIFGGFADIIHQREMDFTESRAIVVAIAFFAYGSLETMASSFSFWLLGTLPLGEASIKNRFVGGSRAFCNLGGAISWAMDINHAVPYLTQWIISLCLWVISLLGVWAVTQRTLARSEREKLKSMAESEADDPFLIVSHC